MMKKAAWLVLLLPLFLGSCLKHDLLKQDADTNFTESEFYLSGGFDKTKMVLIEIVGIDSAVVNVDYKCKPILDIRLEEEFVQQLENSNWDASMQIRLTSKKGETVEFPSTANLRETFRTDLPRFDRVFCGQDFTFDISLQLLAPNLRVVASTERERTVSTQ